MALGFLAPALYLAIEAWRRFSFAGLSDDLLIEARNTFLLSATATSAVLISGVVIAYAARAFPRRAVRTRAPLLRVAPSVLTAALRPATAGTDPNGRPPVDMDTDGEPADPEKAAEKSRERDDELAAIDNPAWSLL